MEIFKRIEKFNLPKGQYAVFGSALLDVWGLRHANDLDIIVTPELFEQLKKEGWEEKQGNGFSILSKMDADVTTVQNRPTDGNYNPDRLQLIREAIEINGIPFVRVEEVIACKTAYNREKDLKDIKMLKEYLDSKK
jgi:hypothetical protein